MACTGAAHTLVRRHTHQAARTVAQMPHNVQTHTHTHTRTHNTRVQTQQGTLFTAYQTHTIYAHTRTHMHTHTHLAHTHTFWIRTSLATDEFKIQDCDHCQEDNSHDDNDLNPSRSAPAFAVRVSRVTACTTRDLGDSRDQQPERHHVQ